MNVLYDHQIWLMQRFGGISRYFIELMKNSGGLFNYSVTGVYSSNEYLKDMGLHKDFPVSFNFKGRRRILKRLNEGESVKQMNGDSVDILHPTYFSPYFNTSKKVVLTVYDMIYELFPEMMCDGEMINMRKETVHKADKIIAISECTKKDLLRIYPDISPDKVEVTYLGNSFPVSENASKENYILFTGNRASYKNFANFARAVAPVLIENNLKLICTGSKFASWELWFLDQLGIGDRVESRFVNDAELSDLYSKALLFVFPSLYEGFGIPILESFASSCPLLLSNASCFPEIAGDAGVYFDPYSIDDMREKINSVLMSQAKQQELVEKGRERLKLFDWAKTTRETAEVYKSVLKN